MKRQEKERAFCLLKTKVMSSRSRQVTSEKVTNNICVVLLGSDSLQSTESKSSEDVEERAAYPTPNDIGKLMLYYVQSWCVLTFLIQPQKTWRDMIPVKKYPMRGKTKCSPRIIVSYHKQINRGNIIKHFRRFRI